jgi:hypothetical protein
LRAGEVPFDAEPSRAAAILGSGQQVISTDTVPFALWCAARHLDIIASSLGRR